MQNTKPNPVWHWLTFSELSQQQLYQLLQLRQIVFVVEQNCVYLDADDFDQDAWHLLGEINGEFATYCRVLKPNTKYPEPSIGRVLTAAKYRGTGIGKALMSVALRHLEQEMPRSNIRISAQLHLKKYYEDFGFEAVSTPYDEDGIAHIEMLRSKLS